MRTLQSILGGADNIKSSMDAEAMGKWLRTQPTHGMDPISFNFHNYDNPNVIKIEHGRISCSQLKMAYFTKDNPVPGWVKFEKVLRVNLLGVKLDDYKYIPDIKKVSNLVIGSEELEGLKYVVKNIQSIGRINFVWNDVSKGSTLKFPNTYLDSIVESNPRYNSYYTSRHLNDVSNIHAKSYIYNITCSWDDLGIEIPSRANAVCKISDKELLFKELDTFFENNEVENLVLTNTKMGYEDGLISAYGYKVIRDKKERYKIKTISLSELL